ncbi:hypothetical protein [Rhodalgimonas zhirmunskyi]|uniref:Uncharacterized protein n=1 Tax=Rhodalgimonas zhirmunskyi TaxID=2964767 RepID=A0AAJ1X7G8_9RHOB|nr:hypothetical protein [Rhodoalgimonas zhirmunskyi]MDQ2094507.1 hypothetical protein [Rhodoalgimonas zhirmunskyi]
MGDFQDVFGAGADAVDIIEGFNRQYLREQRINAREARTARRHTESDESWIATMRASGYVEGPFLASFDALSRWERASPAPHVRRPMKGGYQVFFSKV